MLFWLSRDASRAPGVKGAAVKVVRVTEGQMANALASRVSKKFAARRQRHVVYLKMRRALAEIVSVFLEKPTKKKVETQ
jgi:biotin carboxylase